MRIGNLINSWRRIQDIGIRDAAKMIGMSASTLSRIENGENFDAQTMAKILTWLFAAEPRKQRGDDV